MRVLIVSPTGVDAEGLQSRGHAVLVTDARARGLRASVAELRQTARGFRPDVVVTQSTTATAAARVAAPRLPRVALRSGSVRSDQTLDRLDAALRTAVGALPLRARPYNEAVRLAERRRIRRARPSESGPVPGVRVLAYHRVAEAGHDPLAVTPSEFAAHLEAIERSGAEVVTLRRAAELVADRSGGRFVAITFDDGYLDTAEVALPLLERRGFPATVFVVTGVLDGISGFYWYRRNPPPALGWNDVDALVRHGLIEVQSHGRTHAALPALDDDLARDEIAGSRRALAARLPYDVWAFSYPAGRSSPRDHGAVAEAGYAAGFGTRPGIDAGAGDRLDLRRTVIRPGLSQADLSAVLGGAIDRDTRLRAMAHARRSRRA